MSANTTNSPDDFDARLDLKIAAAQLRLRVHIEIFGNRARRDQNLFAHQKFCELYRSINYGAAMPFLDFIGIHAAAIDYSPRDPDEVFSVHTHIIEQRATA